MEDPGRIPFTIANGQSLSGVVPLQGLEVVGIIMPAAWTAAALTFQSADIADPPAGGSTTYQNIYSTGGTELNYTVDAARRIPVDPNAFGRHSAVKVRSGTSGAAVNQGADRIGYLVVRKAVR